MADKGLKIEVVTQQFGAMLRELAAIDARVEFATVVRNEAAAVEGGAMTRTKAASIPNIERRSAEQKFTTFNGKTYYIDRNYKDKALANALHNQRIFQKNRRLAARGISKQSWAHVARAQGSTVQAPAYVLTANYKGQQYPQDGAASESGTGASFALTITNSSPVVQKAGGQFALLVSMNARARYFERNMAHFFFMTMANRVKKYPGIFAGPVPLALDVPTGMFGS